MSGELWRSTTAVAKEVVYGTAVQPATRKTYYSDPLFHLVRAPRAHAFATGTRDNVRSFTVGPQEVSGDLKLPLDSSEIIELLLGCVSGGVTPTQPNAGTDPTVYLWTFEPTNSLDSSTVEFQDGARAWLVSGVLCDKINIKGSANGPNDVTATMFGKAITATTMTGGLSDREVGVTEGWEASLYIDAFGGTPGTTLLNGTLVNWDVSIMANLQRKYLAANQNSLASVPIGVLGAEATLTFEASASDSITEFNNWNVALASPTLRLLRLDFGENAVISHSYHKSTILDLPGAWSAFDLGQADAGTRVYQLKMSYVYDPTNLFGVRVLCQNTRAAAWV